MFYGRRDTDRTVDRRYDSVALLVNYPTALGERTREEMVERFEVLRRLAIDLLQIDTVYPHECGDELILHPANSHARKPVNKRGQCVSRQAILQQNKESLQHTNFCRAEC